MSLHENQSLTQAKTVPNDLSKPARRKAIHSRTYDAQAYEREDGLFDVEVEMRDTKPFSFDNTDRGYVAAGEPLHHMKMRVTLDETMEIRDIEARTLASPYHMCGAITDNYRALIGLKIVGGFLKKAAQITGRQHGCTHHNDMLKVMGTTAFQGLWTVISRRLKARAEQAALEKKKQETGTQEAGKQGGEEADLNATTQKFIGKSAAAALLNTCHAYAEDSPIVKRQWPHAYKGDKGQD